MLLPIDFSYFFCHTETTSPASVGDSPNVACTTRPLIQSCSFTTMINKVTKTVTIISSLTTTLSAPTTLTQTDIHVYVYIIAGLVIGVVILALVICIVLLCCLLSRKNNDCFRTNINQGIYNYSCNLYYTYNYIIYRTALSPVQLHVLC